MAAGLNAMQPAFSAESIGRNTSRPGFLFAELTGLHFNGRRNNS
jgi:hypothetical protein